MPYSELAPTIKKLAYKIKELDIRESTKKYLLNRLNSKSHNHNIYAVYPYIYSKPFYYQNEDVLIKLSLASYLYYISIIIIDKITDKQTSKSSDLVLISHECNNISIQLLIDLFPKKSKFWLYFNKRNKEWLSSYDFESKLNYKNRLTDDEIFNFFILKSSIGKLAIDALYVLTDNGDIYTKLLYLYNNFYISRQIQDDMSDFNEDLINGQFNIAIYFTKKIIYENPNLKNQPIKKVYYLSVYLDLIKKGLHYLNNCHSYINNNKFIFFAKRIKFIENIFVQQIEIFSNYKEQVLIKENIVNQIKNPFDNQLLSNSFDFLIKEWKTGYNELQHKMLLPKDDYLSYQSVNGDVFQRAIITSHLIEINSFFDIDNLDLIIEYERNYLLSKKYNKIGWKYFPNYDELPTDIDDLAQMIQVFQGISMKEFARIFSTPLTTLFKYYNKPFKTWVYSEKNKKIEVNNVSNRWGDTFDNGVIANIIYSMSLIQNRLICIDKLLLKTVIDFNIEFLKKNQLSNGFWDSNWYANPFYVMYIAMKAIGTQKNNMIFIEKTKEILIQSHLNIDGSFGKSKEKALDTALSILILQNNGINRNHKDIIQKSVKFLISLMKKDGHFISSNFIKMDLGRAKNKIHKTLYYKSNTLCTSYCLLSLLSSKKNGIKI